MLFDSAAGSGPIRIGVDPSGDCDPP